MTRHVHASGLLGKGSHALVDVHVHFHAGYDEARFLNSALTNFSEAAHALEIPGEWTGILVLTESSGCGAFRRFFAGRTGDHPGALAFEATEEEFSVVVRSAAWSGKSGSHLTMVAGRQIGTKEGLEVLALPLLEPIPDGLPLEDVVSRVSEMGAIAVLPWGFGKWSGGRGVLVARMLDLRQPGGFLLADGPHRPRFAPFPRILKKGEAASIPILTGSDPLPLAGEELRAGSCCILLGPTEWKRTPGLALKGALQQLSESPPRYEKRPGIPRFAVGQIAMQCRKRFKRWRS